MHLSLSAAKRVFERKDAKFKRYVLEFNNQKKGLKTLRLEAEENTKDINQFRREADEMKAVIEQKKEEGLWDPGGRPEHLEQYAQWQAKQDQFQEAYDKSRALVERNEKAFSRQRKVYWWVQDFMTKREEEGRIDPSTSARLLKDMGMERPKLEKYVPKVARGLD